VATTRTRSRESGLKGPVGRQVVAGPCNHRKRTERRLTVGVRSLSGHNSYDGKCQYLPVSLRDKSILSVRTSRSLVRASRRS